MDFIKPTFTPEELFKGKEFADTPPGTYKMLLHITDKSPLRIRKTRAGNLALNIFLTHVEEEMKGKYNGVNGQVGLTGVDKNGKELGRQFNQFLYALGIAEDQIAHGGTGAVPLADVDDLPADDWKGVPATIKLCGDEVDLHGKILTVKVEAYTSNGKQRTRADGFYRV